MTVADLRRYLEQLPSDMVVKVNHMHEGPADPKIRIMADNPKDVDSLTLIIE